MSQNHACSPKAIYVEITGRHADNDQNEYWLYQGDAAEEHLAEGDASEGRFGPIVESQQEYLEDELANYRLVQKIGDIEVPLLQVEEISQCGLIPTQRAFQHHLMVSTVPMLYLDHQELAAGPCRGGFLYVFLDGRLIRELVVSGETNQAPRFIDSDIATYRQQGGEIPAVREFTGPALAHLHLPLKLNGEAANVRLAFSDHPWPWAHIEQLEANPGLIEKRCQPLALNESSVSAMLQGSVRNMYAHCLDTNRDECAGKAAVDWLPPMRPRDAVYEQAWGSARDYLEDITAAGWNRLIEQLQAERAFFESDEQQATSPDIDEQTRQRHFAPALRSCLVQQWNNANRSDDDRADDASLALLPAPEGLEDCLTELREKQLCAIFLRDPKQVMEHLIEDIQAGQELLWVLSEGMKYHPHGKSAELIQANCFMPYGPEGEDNPLYLDTWYDTRLDRSRESLFARLIKEEERRLARLRIDEQLSALVAQFNDTSPGAFCHTLRDAMLFSDINHLEPYALLARCIETLQIGLNCLDFKATPDEANALQAPAQCQQALEALFAASLQQAAHACSPLLFAEENCSTNVWGSPYARNLGALQVAARNVMDQQDQVATPTGEQLIAWQQRLDEEVNDLGPAMSRARMALNGTDAVASHILPPLLNVVPGLKLGETMTLTLATDVADLKSALMGGLPIEVVDTDGVVHWLLPSQFKPLTEEMAQGGIALQAASARNVLGGEVASTSAAMGRANMTGQVTSEQAFRWTQTGYMGLWSGLAGLEFYNLASTLVKLGDDFNSKNIFSFLSALADASLLSAQGLKLANVNWGWAVRANNLLDTSYAKLTWKEAMGDAGRYRGALGFTAGLFTATLVAVDAFQLYQQQQYTSGHWTAGASAAIGIGSYTGSGFGQAAANIAEQNLVRNQFLHRLLGVIGTPRPVPVMLASLAVAFVCHSMATNSRDDRVSLWTRYGPFGNQQDEHEGRLRALTQKEESETSDHDTNIRDYLGALQNASPQQAFMMLLQGLFQARFELVAPRGLVDIDPGFQDCDIAIRMTCPGLRYGEFRLPITQVEAACSAPVPDRRHTYQYVPMDRRRLLVDISRQDPEDPTVRYLGIRLPREWRRLGVPNTGLGDVPAQWLAASHGQFRHEPDYQREYYQGHYLVRINLGDIEGQGSLEYWDSVERQHRTLEESVSFAAQPSTLTWVWNQQGVGA